MAAVDVIRDGLIQFGKTRAAVANEALSSWKGRGFPRADPKTAREEPEATVGVCEMCGKRGALRACLHCRRMVCSGDFWPMIGLCRGCGDARKPDGSASTARRPPDDLAIKWVED